MERPEHRSLPPCRPAGKAYILLNHSVLKELPRTIYQTADCYNVYNWEVRGFCCKKHSGSFPHQDNRQSSWRGKTRLLIWPFVQATNFFVLLPHQSLCLSAINRWQYNLQNLRIWVPLVT